MENGDLNSVDVEFLVTVQGLQHRNDYFHRRRIYNAELKHHPRMRIKTKIPNDCLLQSINAAFALVDLRYV